MVHSRRTQSQFGTFLKHWHTRGIDRRLEIPSGESGVAFFSLAPHCRALLRTGLDLLRELKNIKK
jgi:hypothetical protein